MKTCILSFLVFLTFPFFAANAQQNCSLAVRGVVKNPSCSGGMDGAIQLEVRGGAAPYTYQWNSGQATSSTDKLSAGTYRVKVQDQRGCITTAEFSLTAQEKDLGLQVVQKISTSGKKSLTVKFAGNTPPYAMYIRKSSGGFYGSKFVYEGQALEEGVYLLEAFTASGCSVFEQVKIEVN